jgi:membrane protein YqaA with SNARE-associated domain
VIQLIGDLLHGFSSALHLLLSWVESFAARPEGPAALFVLAFMESSFFPIPPDVLLIALCLGDPALSFWFAFLCSLGSVLGGMAGYGIGYWGGRPLLRRLFRPERVEKVAEYYDRYNAWAIGIAGLTPLPYKLFTVSGGAFVINFRIFVAASVASRTARFFAVATTIYFYGQPVKAFLTRYLDVLTISFVLLLLAGYWVMSRRAGKVARSQG